MPTVSPTPGEPAELNALIALAQREHRAGRLAEAAEAYRRILAKQPGIAEVHNNLGVLLGQQRQLDQAAARFEQAIALKPGYAEAHNNLGNLLMKQGQLQPAAAHLEQVVALAPGKAEAHNNLGIILAQLGQLEPAAARFEQALALRPDFAEAHYNLGNVLLKQGESDQAVERFEQALELKPDCVEAYNNLGNVLMQLGQLDEAAALYQQALALRPRYAEAINNLGTVLAQQGQSDEARALYRQAVALRPDYAEAHNNLGSALWKQGEFDQAVAHLEQALARKPDWAEARINLGKVLGSQARLAEAEQCYRQVLALRHDDAEAQFGLAVCFLAKGDFQRGWPAYESRLRVPGAMRLPNLPRWSGEPLAGRSLLVLAEAGLGDTIQFVRYARLLKERGARVVLAVQPPLARLLASGRDWDELCLLDSNHPLPTCDFYLPLMSAPYVLGGGEAMIPPEAPYLAADPRLTDDWRRELSAVEGFKIGIAWQTSRRAIANRWRSIPLAEFAPLARLPGVRLISLQKEFGTDEIATVDFPVLDLSERLDEAAGPLVDTAAVIGNLDLVISADTAIGHLAGALGAPVWLALNLANDWRWQSDREDSPWYPTMRLFRQTAFARWSDVFERMARAVAERPGAQDTTP